MRIVVAAALVMRRTLMTKQQRVVALTLVHAALKKKQVPMIRSPVTLKKNRAVALVAATKPARQIRMAKTRNLATLVK
jgi:hypothetical protein